MADISINGKLSVKITDEEMDRLVIDHLNDAIVTCNNMIELVKRDMEKPQDHEWKAVCIQEIEDNMRYIENLNAVIQFFGGQSIL